MEHIGIDLGATHSHITISTEAGDKTRRKLRTDELPSWLGKRERARVVMEACTQSPAIATAAISADHDVRVVPAQLVRALGVGARGIKTDSRDADVLADASVRVGELPSVHLRSRESADARGLLASRALLVKSRSSIAVSLKSWLRGRLITMRGRISSQCFTERFRELALEHPEGLPLHIESLLQAFDSLSEQIRALDTEVSKRARADEVCQRLQTMPGIGPVVSLMLRTQLDEAERFGSASQLASYLALVPGESTTGGKIKRTGVLKAGPRYLKAMLIQSAWTMWRVRPGDPLVVRTQMLAERRGKRIAVVALARKMAIILWAMWRRGQDYDPSRACRNEPSES